MKKIIWAIIVIVIIVLIVLGLSQNKSDKGIRIGVITPLTGGAAYWGESSLVGIELAKQQLLSEGIDIQIVVEDGQLDPNVALNAVQKLVNVDNVNAVYSEFNPAAISVSSFLKDKKIIHIYDAAVESPLAESQYNFKSYLDYYNSCKEVAGILKDRNINKVGVLKINLEFGDLCLKGIQETFGNENVFIEEYNPGNVDFRSNISKISQNNVEAIFNVSFQPETLASIRQLGELNITIPFIGLAETITQDIKNVYSLLIQDDIFFGLPEISGELREKIKVQNGEKDVSDYNASALAYVHILQLGRSLNKCGNNIGCLTKSISESSPVLEAGFEGFFNRIAKFENRVVKFENGEFVEVK